jgi:hypothetical protein
MRPLMLNLLLPMAAMAATAVPTDPARAGELCLRAEPAMKVSAPAPVRETRAVETKKETKRQKLEAL